MTPKLIACVYGLYIGWELGAILWWLGYGR